MMLLQVVLEFLVFWVEIFLNLFTCHCWGGLREQNLYKVTTDILNFLFFFHQMNMMFCFFFHSLNFHVSLRA